MPSLKAIACVLLLAASAWGASEAPRPARSATAKRAVQAVKSDAEIERDIRARLARSKIGKDGFQVHVQGGVATWEGKTDVLQHKGAATRMAKSAGAIAVKNQIQVSDAAREKAARNLESGRRRAQVKRGEPRSETGTGRSER